MKQPRLISSDFFFMIIVIALAAVSLLSYQRIQTLTKASDRVNHTNIVRLKLNETLVDLIDAETAQRGYLLTKDSAFIEPFTGTFIHTEKLMLQLDSLTADDPEQHKNFEKLQALVDRRYKWLDYILKIGDTTKNITPFLMVGKDIMTEITDRVASMFKIEEALLKKRIRTRDRYEVITPLFSLNLTVLTLLIVILSFLKIRADKLKLEHLNRELTGRDEMLTAKNKELESSNTELASFNYIASHDLQEPLRKINIFSNRILDKEVQHFSEDTNQYFSRIIAAAERMQNLIDALLSYSRADTSEIIFKQTDLNKLVEEVKINVQDEIQEKNAVIQSVSLPKLNVVPLQFHQLLLNLISNAIKYSKENVQPLIKITADVVAGEEIHLPEAAKENKYWKITVADNGIGFEKQYEKKVFDLFQRLHGKKEYSGTGIGLAICKKIMQNHNGFITATGQPGIGATFNIYLPFNQ
ncbi:MAG: CHASE3 domain-containing protein [Bacteroidota bacterium]|nr:CHASE3 domain-containing protein [Bacteroidota bacterium]